MSSGLNLLIAENNSNTDSSDTETAMDDIKSINDPPDLPNAEEIILSILQDIVDDITKPKLDLKTQVQDHICKSMINLEISEEESVVSINNQKWMSESDLSVQDPNNPPPKPPRLFRKKKQVPIPSNR